MKPSVHSVRRATAVIAIFGAAALNLTAASAAGTARPAIATCLSSNLTVWVGEPADHAAGHAFYELEFSNTAGPACSLSGYPGVTAVNGSGMQLGSAAGHDTIFAPSTVVLTHGATAHAVLTVANVGFFTPSQCHPTTSAALHIAIGQGAVSVLPFAVGACAKKGPVYLHIRVVRPGTGIPGFSQ